MTGLIRRWDCRVLSVAFRCLGNWEDALDVRQQTFQRLVSRIRAFDPDGMFAPWLYRIVVNLCRDRRRGDRARERAANGLRTRAGRMSPDGRAPERAAPNEVAAIVRDAVLGLPTDEREVVVLRHYANLSFPDMAAVLDVPASTLKSRSIRALKRLRAHFCKMGLDTFQEALES